MHLVIFVVSFMHTISPCQLTLSMLLVVVPISFIDRTLLPYIGTLSMPFIFYPITIISTTGLIMTLSLSMFFIVNNITVIFFKVRHVCCYNSFSSCETVFDFTVKIIKIIITYSNTKILSVFSFYKLIVFICYFIRVFIIIF